MPQNSNWQQVQGFLDEFVDGFNYKRPGIDQSLGRDVAMKVVERIADRSLADRRSVDEDWAPNEEKYAAWKAKRYSIGEDEPNTRTGQMLSQLSLYGRTRIDEKEITMIYGVNAPPTRTATGVPLTKADQKVTDVQKAYFAHAGQGKHKITRPFYQVDETDGKAVSELCQANLNEWILETNAKNGY